MEQGEEVMSLKRRGVLEWVITSGSPSSLSDWCRSPRPSGQSRSGGNHRQHSPAILDSRKGQWQPHHWLYHPGSNTFHRGLAGCRHRCPTTAVLVVFMSGLGKVFIYLLFNLWCDALILTLQCQRRSTVTCWQPRWWVWTPGWSTSSGWWPVML